MLFLNGQTDNLAAKALYRIEWRISFNILRGKCPDDALFRAGIPKFQAPSGRFEITRGFMAGEQRTVIDWYRDENQIIFQVHSVSEPI